MTKDMINPSHYQREGRKQCIEEMEDKFTIDATVIFAILNAYKYGYRCGLKDLEEQELKKIEWYEQFADKHIYECSPFTKMIYNAYWADKDNQNK